MEWKRIETELRRLSSLVDGWAAAGRVPPLEQDIALDKLRAIYEEIRFAETHAGPLSDQARGTDASAAVPSFGIDLEEAMAATENDLAQSPDTSAWEPVAGVAETAQSEQLEAVASGPVSASGWKPSSDADGQHNRTAGAQTGADEADGTCPEPDASPTSEGRDRILSESATGSAASAPAIAEEATVVGNAAAAAQSTASPAVSRQHSPSEDSAASAPAAVDPSDAVASGPESTSGPEPSSDVVSSGGQEPLFNSLFDLDDLVDRRRKNRRVILSLYGSDEEELCAPSERPGTRRKKRDSDGGHSEDPFAPATGPNAERAMQPAASARREQADASAACVPEPDKNTPVRATPSEAGNIGQVADGGTSGPVSTQATVGEQAGSFAPPSDALRSETERQPSETIRQAERRSEPAEASALSEEAVRAGKREAAAGESAAGAFAVRTAEESPLSTPLPTEPCEEREEGVHQVLGEVIGRGVQTLADRITAPQDRAATLARGEPVEELRKAIGVNDRFLMIRDLFGGDAAAYERALDELEAFDDLDDCLIHIAEQYAWDAGSDGARLLMDLLERKLG